MTGAEDLARQIKRGDLPPRELTDSTMRLLADAVLVLSAKLRIAHTETEARADIIRAAMAAATKGDIITVTEILSGAPTDVFSPGQFIPTGESAMVFIGPDREHSYRCECGGNVFTKGHRPNGSGDLFRCNSCGNIYEGTASI